ncbi:extracellular solute-binding protein [Kribbella sp. NPDC048928]|uniref:extracellular solute-binding protein n=1 Tax=Kribbella sp. NPDC048928 TaxID=3364111 RepID=UPI003721CD77
MHGLSRRDLMRAGLTIAAAAAAGTSLGACSNKGRGGPAGDLNAGVALPKYLRYKGFRPDLIGKDGVDDGTLAYPANPPKATTGAPGDGRPVSALAMTNTPVPPALRNNVYWRQLNRRLGFDLQVELVPSADFSQRFQTAVAGDKLPDLFAMFTGSVPSLPSMLDKKAVDLTPHLSGDAIAKYPLLANLPTESWKLTTFGGKIFGVPVPRGAQSSTTLYGRRDLLEREKLTAEPKSLDDFASLCRQLTAPASNVWALGRVPLTWIQQAFGIPNSWSVQDGKLVSTLEHEHQKDALNAARKLVQSGVVHPDSFGAPTTTWKTWMANDAIWLVDDTFSGWPGFYLYPVPESFRLLTWSPPALDGGRAPIWLGSPTYSMTSINVRAAERVEALLSVLNYLAAPFGTEEYLFKYFGVKGVDHRLQGTDPQLTAKGRSETQLSMKYLAEGPWMIYQPGRPQVTRDAFEAQSRLVPGALQDPTRGLYSETDIRSGAQIGLGDLVNDILQGRQPVNKWDSAVAEWKKKGGGKIRDEYQEALDKAGPR